MMKNTICFSILALMLGACATDHQSSTEVTTPQVGLANPASKFCVEQGGTLKIQNETSGQVGYCHLKDGSVFEEWSFFRSYNSCISDKVSSLIGQQNLSDEEIRKLTHARQIRRLEPGQPMTMDFREDRVNITIDQKSKKIIHATCG
nr:I78 family peptidase inhibitor [Acinetobacter shaoyimingii]